MRHCVVNASVLCTILLAVSPCAALAAPPARTAGPRGDLDTEPPVLTSISLPRPVVRVGSGHPYGALSIDLTATDNQTGIVLVDATVRSASGDASLSVRKTISVPQTSLRGTVLLPFWSDAKPGDWLVESIVIADSQGNHRLYGTSDLAAMGDLRFAVRSRQPYEMDAPTLKGGRVLTPVVSRRTPPPGEDSFRTGRLGLELSVTDAGPGYTSGLKVAYLSLQEEVSQTMFHLSGEALRAGASSGRIPVGRYAEWAMPLGRYRVYRISVVDQIGNFHEYTRADTDFDALFGGDASITVIE